MFMNYMTGKLESDAVESKYGSRWFIKMGFAGFNSSANNRFGYDSKQKAEAAIKRYQSK